MHLVRYLDKHVFDCEMFVYIGEEKDGVLVYRFRIVSYMKADWYVKYVINNVDCYSE